MPQPCREGNSLYDGVAPVRVRIEEVDCIPGSGDYEDPPELQEDRYGCFLQVVHTDFHDSGFCNGRGPYETIEEAVRGVERLFKGIVWDDV